MPYQKKVWCAHPIHSASTRSGRSPSHPEGRIIINAIQADLFNNEISSNAEWSSKMLSAGDLLCKRCLKFLSISSDESFDSQEMDVDNEDRMSINDATDEPEDLVDSPSFDERLLTQQEEEKN
jgi:hypothetical protein